MLILIHVARLYYKAQRPRCDRGHGWGKVRLVHFDNGPEIMVADIAPVAPRAPD